MVKNTSREAAAIKKLDESALVAQERITAAADKAQKMIDDACASATATLELSTRIPDKRNINGSFQWDRGDRYRRGSDEQIKRLEDKFDDLNKTCGSLEVGQAKREEQITGLMGDYKSMARDIAQLRHELEAAHKEMVIRIDNAVREMADRMSTMRELVLEVKDAADNKIDTLRDEGQKNKIKTQQYVITIVVGFIVVVITTIFRYVLAL